MPVFNLGEALAKVTSEEWERFDADNEARTRELIEGLPDVEGQFTGYLVTPENVIALDLGIEPPSEN